MSLNCPGYAIIEVCNRQAHLVEKGHVKAKSNYTHGQKLKQIEQELIRLREKYEYKKIIRERGFCKFKKATQALYKVVGVCDLTFNPVNIEEIPPTTVKLQVAGNGGAAKSEVEKAVRRILQLDNKTKFATDDESDAVGVVLAYLIREGLID